MARHTSTLVQDLDRGVGDARLELLADEARRHGVIVIGDLNVVVGRDPAVLPLGILVRRGRKGLERRPIDLCEQLVPADAELAHDLGVEVGDSPADRGIEFMEREEAVVAQPRQHKALHNLHRHFDLGLVARPPRTRGKDRGVVVLGQLLVGAVDPGLIAANRCDAGLEVVADHRLRHAADHVQGVDVRPNPVGKPFRPAGLRVGVVGRSQHRDEDMSASLYAAGGIEHRHRVAGKVDEQLLGGAMRLPHGWRDGLAPLPVKIAKPAVAVTISVLGPVFLPQHCG